MSAVLKSSDFAATTQPRYNIYTIVHKGLRGFMADTLLKWGKTDFQDEQERAATFMQVRALLDMCTGHLHHENTFLHTALEAIRSGTAQRTANEHVEHEHEIAQLRTQVAAVEAASAQQQTMLAQQLYLHLSAFIAENLEHMIVEETANHAVLCAAYSDAQILEIEHRLVASLTPEQSFAGLRWMISHINATERAFMLGGMKVGAPPPVFNAVMGLAREVLSERDFNKLQTALA